MHTALSVILDEHSTLSALLRSINLLLDATRKHKITPDFAVLRALLFYIDEFPERLHHKKESELLFPRLRERSPEISPVLDRLDHDHAVSEKAVRDLQHEMLGCEMMADSADGEARREHFEQSMHAYISTYLEHMRIEEHDVLPLAERVLTQADWAQLDTAFMRNRDPLTRREADDAYRPLFKKILMSLPAPIGIGPAMEAMSVSRARPTFGAD